MSISHRAVAPALAGLLAASCGGKKDPGAGGGGGTAPPSPAYVQPAEPPDGLDLRVSDGKQGPPAYDRARLAPATPLPDGEVQALLARTKPIASDAADPQVFALRPASQPAPRTGQTITVAFPPPPSSSSSLRPPPASAGAGEALRVLRWMPEGPVPLAPELSVTFSQPMIAVTSQTDAAATTPVKLTPQPPGRWRWIGTRTILFDPDVRFPQATTYRVEIPAGTKSASGAALAAATSFTFETPPPTLQASFPSDGPPQHLDPAMFVRFDQKIDPQAVLGRLRVTADGRPWSVVALSPFDLEKMERSRRADHRQVASLAHAAKQNSEADRYLAFRPAQPFPPDAAVEVVIPEGTRSAEGPNPTQKAQRFAFRTYPRLRVEKAECGGDCVPGQAFAIDFSNPLDTAAVDPKLVSITPAVPGLRVVASGDHLILSGPTAPRTRYQVTISRELADEFGQRLGADETVTWLVGDAQPTFFGPDGVVVLDPSAKKPALDFFSTNHASLKVRLYKVAPSDYGAYRAYVRDRWNRDRPPPPPGALVFDDLVSTGGGPNQLVETAIDLSRALGPSGLGHAIAIVEPHPWKHPHEPPRMVSWVQSTRLAVDAHVDADDLVAFATDLATGQPAAGVALELRPSGARAETDATGLATLPLSAGPGRGAHHLLARRGDDVALLDDGSYWGEGGAWTKRARPPQLVWYVVDDRKLYKPGEEVSLKGLLRALDPGEHGDLGLPGATSVAYTVNDSRGNKLATGTAAVSAAGSFDTRFTLPATPNLGPAHIELVASGRTSWAESRHLHVFQIEEFRRPEFEVTARASQGPFLVRDGGDVTVSAKYYAGGPLPGADVSWTVSASPTSYTPPNRDDYTFGEWVPWWGHHGGFGLHGGDGDDGGDLGGRFGYRPPRTWTLAGKTDATGAHTMHLDFLSVKPALPMSVTASASVTDVNRQAWSASQALIVHPALYYVGLKAKKPFVEKGTPFELDVIGVDLDGKPAIGARIDLTAVRLDWEYKDGRYRTKEVDPQPCAIAAAKDPQPCRFATKTGGTYQVTAKIFDLKGRVNQTRLMFWVTGGDQPRARDVEQERVQIIPDRKQYAAGTTAELLLQSPFYPAEGVVSWRRSGIVKLERIRLDGPTKVIAVPITDAMVPNLHVQVDLVGTAPRLDDKGAPDPKLPPRPAYAVGTIDLEVPPKQRTLAVEVAPAAAKLSPGETTELSLQVKDAAGKPAAGAEVAVIVVDEAILALAGHQLADPVGVFYGHRPADVADHYLRAHVKLATPDAGRFASGQGQQAQRGLQLDLARAEGGLAMVPSTGDFSSGFDRPTAADPAPPAEKPSPARQVLKAEPNFQAQAGKLQQGGRAPAIAIRSNFNPLAAFAPAVKTDAAGRAKVSVKVPDNLTRYRIMAIATAGEKQLGKGESALVARLPLMVRPSPPRFLNFGDTFQLPVVVQNQTDAPMAVKLAVRATNAALTAGAGREVTVPANDRVEVRFPAAAELAGTARFQVVGTAGAAADAAEVALPVWTPATTEAFATYGVIDDGAPGATIRQPVALPGKVVTQFGGLEVSAASTNLQALTDAMLYLVRYPYECAEQRASRVMAIAALRDVLTAFRAKDLPAAQAMDASVRADIERLAQLQNPDGGFAFWERGHASVPYVTVYVASALARARKKGYAVPAGLVDAARTYLRDIERHYPSSYGPEVRRAISAFALYTRKQLGDLDIAKGQRLLAEAGGVEKVTVETSGWLLGLFAGNRGAEAERKAIVRHALNRVSETAGAAGFVTSYGDGAHLLLASDHRVDAVMLESLIQEQPDLDLIPKLVTGLLGHRKAGRWLNTQENTFALVAMDLYFHTYEKVSPDFVARVWLGDASAGERAFRGRTTDTFAIQVPMKEVAARDGQALTIQKDGGGRLYYRIGMTYAPASLSLDPADHGFVVERRYEGADDPKDVVRQPDGTWKIKAGARVRVKLTVVNEHRRYHVAVVDPLPAGLEPMNPRLATTGPIPEDPAAQQARGPYWWWYGPWYEHQNLRDERVEAFASLLWEGVHRYEYVARATTPGSFVVPPPKAEEMYMPETFGRGASDRVVVE